MSDQTHESASGALPLPETPNLEWLRKRAKHRLDELRHLHPEATVADAQFALAKEYGFPSWRALKSHVDSQPSTASSSTRRAEVTSSNWQHCWTSIPTSFTSATNRTSIRCCTSPPTMATWAPSIIY